MGGWGRDMNLEIPGTRPQGWEEGSETLRESHPENSHSHIALRLKGPLTTVLPLDCPPSLEMLHTLGFRRWLCTLANLGNLLESSDYLKVGKGCL